MAEQIGSIIWQVKRLKGGESLVLFKIKPESLSGMLSRAFLSGCYEVNRVMIIDSQWKTQKAVRITKKKGKWDNAGKEK